METSLFGLVKIDCHAGRVCAHLIMYIIIFYTTIWKTIVHAYFPLENQTGETQFRVTSGSRDDRKSFILFRFKNAAHFVGLLFFYFKTETMSCKNIDRYFKTIRSPTIVYAPIHMATFL